MTIWKLTVNEEYNDAFLIDENGKHCYEKDSYFEEIQTMPHTRNLDIEVAEKGFSDIMNYWGTCGSCIVSPKMKALLETYFSDLSIQFFPCSCEQYPDVDMWILNVCEYHDVLDLEKSVYKKRKKRNGEEVISFIFSYAFTEKAFELDMFKIYLNDNKSSVCLYVSDRFKAIMEENGVTGLALEKIYSI